MTQKDLHIFTLYFVNVDVPVFVLCLFSHLVVFKLLVLIYGWGDLCLNITGRHFGNLLLFC